MKKKTSVVIIGAGISGCAAAQELQANKIDYLLLEKNVEPGGLTRSIGVGDGHFDYTGHYLHLSKCNSPEELPYAKQNIENWQLIKRNSAVYVGGEIIPAPLQYNLYALPEHMRRRCIEDFRGRPLLTNPKSFKEYLLSGFGAGICDILLFPYNEKQMATSLENLSVDAVTRFFPHPDEKKIEEGYRKRRRSSLNGYNSHFWYPKQGGIGILAKGLAEGLNNLYINCQVEKINLEEKCLYTSKDKIVYKKLITSMPLKKFCAISNDPRLQRLGRALSHNRVLCLNLLAKRSFPKEICRCHWIYLPEMKIPFYRVGFYSHLPSQFSPPNHTALYIEVAYNHDVSHPDLCSILDEVLSSLEKIKWMRREESIVISANWIDCAYVHFDQDRKKTLNQILTIFKDNDIHPIGRYGLWDYISMEDSIFSGLEVARKLAHG